MQKILKIALEIIKILIEVQNVSIKSNYFKMNREEFDSYLNELKKSKNSIHLLDDQFFYVETTELMKLILEVNKKIDKLDLIINSFSDFTKNQIVQSILIDEIESTNKIESIFSTKHDIFSIINSVSTSKDKKIISISNSYKQLLKTKGEKINDLSDIRCLYDAILKDSIEKDDLPDGNYFRKKPVFISNGIENVHSGIQGEDRIEKYMNEFIDLYNSNNEILTKMILSHFLFEYIHPFYDGNGRFGRYLFSNGLYLETNSYFSFLISSSFEHEKDKYYKAFKEASDKYEFGCLNSYLETILNILSNEAQKYIDNLLLKKEKLYDLPIKFKMSKSEVKIYKLIYEASLFSTFGVSNEEIIKETKVSKRTLIYCLNNFKSKNIIQITKIGKYNFYKCNE